MVWKRCISLYISLVLYTVSSELLQPTEPEQCGKLNCYNYGVCRPIEDVSDIPVCECRGTGFRGPECLDNDPCSPSPCENDGVCKYNENSDGYECVCSGTGHMGYHCENDDPCSPSPCENRGKCKYSDEHFKGYECVCSGTGYIGEHCETDDPCSPSPCKNYGKCEHSQNSKGYKCVCSGTGYVGDNCETGDPCHPWPCNKGMCEDNGDGSYSCNCGGTGYMGDNCEDDDPCSPSPCEWGKCTRLNDAFICDCDPGFGGLKCDIKQPIKYEKGIHVMKMKPNENVQIKNKEKFKNGYE